MNKKRFLALLTASMMLASSMTVLAEDFPSAEGNYTGTGAVETDNAEALSYNKVVLPTLATSTYDFTLDPTGLLPDYDSKYSRTYNVYFNSQAVAATLTAATEGNTLYYLDKDVVSSDALLNAAKAYFTVADGDITAVVSTAAPLYVWTPDSVNAGFGEYTLIDETNVDTYFNVTAAGTEISAFAMKAEHKSKSIGIVCGDDVYIDTWKTLPTGHNATDYVTISAGAISAIADGVVLGEGTSAATFASVTKITDVAKLKYTAATSSYKNTSDVVTITNKSTEAAKVTAKITVSNPSNLSFVSADTFVDDTTTSMYLALVDDEGSATAVVKDAQGAVTLTKVFDLEAVNNTVTKYQDTGVDAVTGGHNYINYENPDPVYDSCGFHIIAKANPTTTVDWSTYTSTIATAGKPGISVVYSIAAAEASDSGDVQTDDYKILVAADGTASYTFVDAPEGALTSVKDGETDRSAGITSNNITYSDGVLSFTKTAVTNWVASTDNTVTVTIGDEEPYSFTVVNNYVLDLTGTTMSYTFAEGTAPSTAITAVTSDVGTHTPGISSNNITYDAETGVLAFTETAMNNWAKNTSYIDCTFDGGTVVHFFVRK